MLQEANGGLGQSLQRPRDLGIKPPAAKAWGFGISSQRFLRVFNENKAYLGLNSIFKRYSDDSKEKMKDSLISSHCSSHSLQRNAFIKFFITIA